MDLPRLNSTFGTRIFGLKLSNGPFALLVCLLGCGGVGHNVGPASGPAAYSNRTVIIDTDMAFDDWGAILYLLNRQNISVKAITISGTGESSCEKGVEHARQLLDLVSYPNIPVACGRETPLKGNHIYPEVWRKEADSLMGAKLPEPTARSLSVNAVDLLASEIRNSSAKVTVLTLGPLTNLAEAIQRDPDLISRIEMIYIMGGAVKVPGNIQTNWVPIENRVAEWNIFIDPRAANVVFRSGAPITLIPLDATNYAPLTPSFYDRLRRKHSGSAANFIFDILKRHRRLVDSGEFFFWDQLAAAILSDESLARFEVARICAVEAEGPQCGLTKYCSEFPQIRIAVAADRVRFENLFIESLNEH